jgi:hypothetical protein
MTKIFKNMGVVIPPSTRKYLASPGCMGTLATFSREGVPHIGIVEYLYPKGLDGVFITLESGSKTHHNLLWQKRASLQLIHENNGCFSILGKAGVVRAPSVVHGGMQVFLLDAISVQRHPFMPIKMDRGVHLRPLDEECAYLKSLLIAELQEICEEY